MKETEKKKKKKKHEESKTEKIYSNDIILVIPLLVGGISTLYSIVLDNFDGQISSVMEDSLK